MSETGPIKPENSPGAPDVTSPANEIALANLDSHAKFTSVNALMAEIIGRKPAETSGIPFSDAFPKLPARISDAITKVLTGTIPSFESKITLDTNTQTNRFHLSLHSTHDTEGLTLILRPVYSMAHIERALIRRLEFEQLITDLSGELAQLPPDKTDAAVTSALGRIVEHLGMDRSTLFEIRARSNEVHTRYSYSRPGIKPAPSIRVDNRFPWMWSMLSQNEIISLSSPDDIPADAAMDRHWMAEIGPHAIVIVPIQVAGRLAYLFTLESFHPVEIWPREIISRQRLAGELIASAAARKLSYLELKRRLEFERTLRKTSALFVNPSPEQFDDDMEAALKTLVELTEVDRASIGIFTKDATSIRMRHAYAREGAARPPAVLTRSSLPWFTQRILDGESVHFNSMEEVPVEAAKEAEMMRSEGMTSYLGLPLRVDSTILGFLSFATLGEEKDWDSDIVSNLEVAASVMSNAIARRDADLEVAALRKELEQENLLLKEDTAAFRGHETIVGMSACIRDILGRVAQVGPTRATVLVTGETGTGKELIAKAIHDASDRRNRTMVKVNCAALPSTLIESELFGREQGAYTGAMTRQIGRFELAHRSTLFLDEIGELSTELQTKLLRVLQEGEFERLGSPKTIKVDVRIVAATNRDLAKAVSEGKFREDLFYRLRVFPLSVPPLRDRLEDIPALVWSFVKEFSRTMGKAVERIPKEDIAALQRYAWPGNIRELRNVVEHAMIVATGTTLRLDLPTSGVANSNRAASLHDSMTAHIEGVLTRTGWRIKGPGGAAEILGINPATLRSKMKKLGIRRPIL